MKTRLLIIFLLGLIGFAGISNSDGEIVIEVPGQTMDISQNIISPGETMFVNGSFNQPIGDFSTSVFKNYEDSRKLVLTLNPDTNEFGDFNFNFRIPHTWELGNYYMVLENGLQSMDWKFTVRQDYGGVTLESDIPRASTPVDAIHMTDMAGNKLSNAKLGEQVFFKLPISNPFVSTKQVDYLFFIFDDGDVVFLKPDTVLLEGKTSTNVLIPWDVTNIGTLDVVLEQFHHNTDIHISPVLQSTVDIQDANLAPLKQFESGSSFDEITCKEDLVLIQKYDNSPACVKENTKQKLAKRGWSENKELLLIMNNNQKDFGRYLKNVSILDKHYINVTMSYPTNTAHHGMYPDEYQSIVSDCIEKNNDANLSLLYLKEIDTKQNQMTFRQENKVFDGLRCDEALWQELTRWGYCGPPGPFLHHMDAIVPSIAEAHRQASFVFDVPKYLPEGYDIQKIVANRGGERMTFYISPQPVTHETSMCEFSWADEGIFLSYVKHADNPSLGSRYSDLPDEPQTWPVTINGNPGRAEQRWIGDRFGTPIPQASDLLLHMPDDGILVTMRSSLPAGEIIQVAESISNPIFNSDIIPDYSHVDALLIQNDNDNSIPVKITGKTAKQICNKVKMVCDDDHYFNASYDVQTNTATFEQSVSYNSYALEINNRQICHKLNKDPTNYCSFLNMHYSSILDGNKDVMLSQPLDYWKNLPRDEQMEFHEEYGDLFFNELGKMVLKDEIKKELAQQNIVNANKDFRLHTGLVEESLPPFVYYTAVVNSTDGKSYVLGGRTHTNQVLQVYHDELIFYDDVSSELPIDSFRNDSPVILIRPENEYDRHSRNLFMNFDKNQDVTFVNSLSVPIRIQDPGSGNPEKEHELAWIGPTMHPSETWTIQINGTGYYEWSAKLAPTEPGGWWEPYATGDVMAYSQDMSDVEFRDKLRIAGEFVLASEIPVSSVGMGNNQGLRIGFSQAITEMLPDAKNYYMARAEQTIPFDVPIIFRN